MNITLYYYDNEGFIFFVESERDETIIYTVAVDYYDGWFCTCEDYQFRKHKCKHIKLCSRYIQTRFRNNARNYIPRYDYSVNDI